MGRNGGAVAGALALHALAAWLLSRVTEPPNAALPARGNTIDVTWTRAPAAPRAPVALTLAPSRPPPPSAPRRRASAGEAHRAAAALRAAASAVTPPSQAEANANAEANAEANANAAGPPKPAAPDLFPHAILQDLARPSAAPPPKEGPGEWLAEANAAARTRAGGVAPVWRDVERALTLGFKPPIDVVHDAPSRPGARAADRLRTLAQQWFATMRDESRMRHPVEPGSTIVDLPAGQSIDPSQQSFYGVPEGLNLRALPHQQQQAAAAANDRPASWLSVEVDIVVDAAGTIVAARVVMPSGRRAFDRFALAAVREQMARAAASTPSTRSRWRCEAGYAVSRVDSIGVQFDLSTLFDKRQRQKAALSYPLQQRVEARVALEWVMPAH
jgi:TonB family protein